MYDTAFDRRRLAALQADWSPLREMHVTADHTCTTSGDR